MVYLYVDLATPQNFHSGKNLFLYSMIIVILNFAIEINFLAINVVVHVALSRIFSFCSMARNYLEISRISLI